nr:ATP synthase F0 subunit 8 [Grammicolepis brachiusculus]
MPQLNPAPWLMIFLFSWLMLLTVIPPKILAHTFPNTPTPQSTQTIKSNPWTWTWH